MFRSGMCKKSHIYVCALKEQSTEKHIGQVCQLRKTRV